MSLRNRAFQLLRQMLGEDKDFRPGQWEAIEIVVEKKQRALLVQRTGWGKSMVYFLATKLLRERGAGPTLLISPLLSLMRNQIEMAEKIGIRAQTINSENPTKWDAVEEALREDACDIILISPERLNNHRFLKKVLPLLSKGIGLFVVDEAHCISDWGHDFRPDYRRIVRILNILPKGTPVLGTTATANNRVIEDIQAQLGRQISVYRGPLARESLRLQSIQISNQSERLAWLAHNLPKFKGSGIVYCMTRADAKRVASWLQQKGFLAKPYYGGNDKNGNDEYEDRPALEQAFLKNEIKILAATVALGMGFDKPDIEFVIHFQRPGSVIAYYQQVGRAGRALEKSYGILLSGPEDDEIHQYFIETAFPSAQNFQDILHALEDSDGLTLDEILARVNVSKSMAGKTLKLLELDGAVRQDYQGKAVYSRTPNPWRLDEERILRVRNLREEELAQMREYVEHRGCLMEFLLRALDDPNPAPCGRCANCQGKGFLARVPQELVVEAENFLKNSPIEIKPRKRWPAQLFPDQSSKIPVELQNEVGISLCYYGDSGWGKSVRLGKYQDGRFSGELVKASADLIRNHWKPNPFPDWVTAIPSARRPHLVPDFAQSLAKALRIPFHPVLIRVKEAPEQKTMQNALMQARNVLDTIGIGQKIPRGPVLLVDDIVDSGWTLTMAGYLLRKNGSGPVYPFTLAQAATRS